MDIRRTLVCFAVKEEATAFQPQPGVAVLVTGMGPRNARMSLERALASQPPALVLTCGFAGGLRPDLPVGALLYAAAPDFPLTTTLAQAGATTARFHCADRVAVTAEEKRRLREQTGADAVEMESGVITEICAQRGIPCATLRVVLDPATEDLPLDFNLLMTDDQKLHAGRLAKALLKSPGKVASLLRLQKSGAQAAARLAGALEKVLA